MNLWVTALRSIQRSIAPSNGYTIIGRMSPLTIEA
jgi:hypothetical protein